MRIALAAALLAASICSSPAAPAAHGLRACRLRNPLGLGSLPARCATFAVPQDRAVRGGARIRLHFAVVPALDRRRPAAPLFILAGGPGQSAIGLYAGLAPAFAAIHRTHDIVLLDQRGTGASAPLNCDYPDDFRSGAGALAQLRRATRACLAKYGDRVRFYTTSVAVRDLDELRRRLGYPQIDLYGASYGTRVAMQYLRRHPAAVHAAILDGVLDPTQAIGPSTPLDAERALRRIVARCERSRDCAAAFPQLPLELASLRRRFGSQTVAVRLDDPTGGVALDVPFSRGVLAASLRFLSYSGAEASLLPLLIHEAAQGRLAPLAAQAVLTSRRIEGQLAIGMQNTVVCSEDVPYFDLGAIDRRRLEATYLGTDQLDALAAICKIWPRGPVDPDLHAPLVSDVPTLLLAGEDDPVTPPAAARAVAAGLAHHRLIVLAGEGHGQLATGCMPRLMARFLASGHPRRLDISCLAAERPPPFFLSPTGPSP
ncbi:MAG TPA: alpha/beta fold hydrolase [Steroidobacteraceae bacterium]|nr:alpha/beta fold hydrolase [Steroidobacteraceae bacterium]